MPYLEIAGVPVISGQVAMPLRGRLVGNVLLDTQKPLERGSRVDARFDGGPVYRCTVERSGPQGGYLAVRVVGGTGGLSTVIEARAYRQFSPAQIARDILEDCGEVAGEIDLPGTLPHWIRPAGAAFEALGALMARYPERTWRVTPDGSVRIGVEDWEDHPNELAIESEDSTQGTYLVAADPTVAPGVRLPMTRGEETLAKRLTRVVHHIGPHLRAEVSTGDGTDQGPSGLANVVRGVMGHTDFMGVYPCRILRDHGDHTLDLQPDHPQLPKLTKVPLVPPIPGSRIKVKKGGTALLMFQHADPSRPLVLQIIGTLELLDIQTGRGQRLLIDDDRGETSDDSRYAAPRLLLQDAAGQVLEMHGAAGAETVTLRDRAGQSLLLSAASMITTLHTTGAIQLNGISVSLADGGPPVARVGDPVQTPAGPGVIIGGSERVVSG